MQAQPDNPATACASCGYNMAGLADTKQCPECGKATFEPIPFHGVPDNFLRTLRAGARTISLAYMAIGLSLFLPTSTSFVVIPLIEHLQQAGNSFLNKQAVEDFLFWDFHNYIDHTTTLLLLSGAVLNAAGWWRLTKIPRSHPFYDILANQKISLRLASCSLAGLVAGLCVGAEGVVLLLATCICLVMFSLDSSRYLRKIADLSGSMELTKRTKRCRLSNHAFCVALALTWIISPITIALASTRNEYNSLRVLLVLGTLALGAAALFLNTVATSTLSATLKAARRHSVDTHSV